VQPLSIQGCESECTDDVCLVQVRLRPDIVWSYPIVIMMSE
jgi:hypothetical protein